ncbi:MAG: hypothetical protein ACREMV_11925 [Gemmatimonadales bacterium]
MSLLQPHMLLNHVPILGVIFGVVLLVAALVRRSDELKRASLVVFVVVAALTVPVYLTGEPAEEAVEGLAGVSETAIEVHEEAALAALVGIEVLGVMALAGLLSWRRAPALAGRLTVGALVLGLVAGGLMTITGSSGGKVRHSELRGGVADTVAEGEDDPER